jgi:hypothetical protein
MIVNRRVLISGIAGFFVGSPMQGVASAQQLRGTVLLVVRSPAVGPSNECLAPCLRGRIFDATDLGDVSTIMPSTLLARVPLCDTIERPWKNNSPRVSSIDRGVYQARIREDATKNWMTTLDRRWRLELSGTAHRTAIQLHYGEDVGWSEGCFIVGDLLDSGAGGFTQKYCRVDNGEAAIARLRAAVTATGRDPARITVAVTDQTELFPGQTRLPACSS